MEKQKKRQRDKQTNGQRDIRQRDKYANGQIDNQANKQRDK